MAASFALNSTKLTVAPAATFSFGSRLLGTKEYDLSDHLGNVTVQLSDRKTGTLVTGDVQTQVLSYQQYFPFGWSAPGRSLNEGKARFGFNGKEDDEEWGIQDYGFRLYDTRVGKFLSFDPLAPEYPELTPYQFASNTPIMAIDLDGLEADLAIYPSSYEGQFGWQGDQVMFMSKAEKFVDKHSEFKPSGFATGKDLLENLEKATEQEGSVRRVATFGHGDRGGCMQKIMLAYI